MKRRKFVDLDGKRYVVVYEGDEVQYILIRKTVVPFHGVEQVVDKSYWHKSHPVGKPQYTVARILAKAKEQDGNSPNR